VFCSFLALVVRKELQDRLERKGWTLEWADLIRDLDSLQEIEIRIDGKGLRHSREMTQVCSPKVTYYLSQIQGTDAGFQDWAERFLPVGKSRERCAS